MEQILSCYSRIPAVTSIPNIFIEKYMLNANGSYVKVYLYFCKCIQSGETGISVAGLADRLESTEKDILRAFQYWEKQGLMRLQYNNNAELSGVEMLYPDTDITLSGSDDINNKPLTDSQQLSSYEESSASTEDAAMQNHEDYEESTSNNIDFSVSNEVSEQLANNENFTWTCHVIESYLNRPLKSTEIQLISYLYGTLHFSSDLLLYLYEYCISLGKTNVRYIQTVALSWDENKVKTPEDAQLITSNYNTVYTAISKAFGLGRPLAMIEKKFVDHWQNDWKMDLGVILDACSRTMLKIHKADFKYTEGILDNWHKADVHTMQDVEKADKAYADMKAEKNSQKNDVQKSNIPKTAMGTANKNQFQSFQQRGTTKSEVDELEKRLLNH